MEKLIVQSGVRLARNFADLPFELNGRQEDASRCVQRVHSALGGGSILCRLTEMDALDCRVLAESHAISPALLQAPDAAAVFLREDSPLAISVGGRDHVHIRRVRPGLALQAAAEDCFRADDQLSRQATFAFDPKLGYLTASPADTGTGMRATLMLHLPLLLRHDSWKQASEIAERAGLMLKSVHQDKKTEGNGLCRLYNRGSLGRTEQEILASVTAAARQITEMEVQLRAQALEKNRAALEDRIFRGWAVLNSARLLSQQEFEACWSGARIGAAMGLLPCRLETLDALPEQACEAHLCAYAGESLTGEALDACRAERVRSLLTGKPLL